jgi:hypothetical protein
MAKSSNPEWNFDSEGEEYMSWFDEIDQEIDEMDDDDDLDDDDASYHRKRPKFRRDLSEFYDHDDLDDGSS